MFNYGSIIQKCKKFMWNTSRDIIRYFFAVVSEDPVYKKKKCHESFANFFFCDVTSCFEIQNI